MPRGKRSTSMLDTPAKREKLPERHDPHWENLQGVPGAALGLFKSDGAPQTWRLRVRLPGRYKFEQLGAVEALDYRAALDRAKERADAIRRADRLAPGVPVLDGEDQPRY